MGGFIGTSERTLWPGGKTWVFSSLYHGHVFCCFFGLDLDFGLYMIVLSHASVCSMIFPVFCCSWVIHSRCANDSPVTGHILSFYLLEDLSGPSACYASEYPYVTVTYLGYVRQSLPTVMFFCVHQLQPTT
ncbi:hypothetical protein CPC08DRAFT_253441 [Agrocybe pediades]|nr:hypothetical protein CPC08DRAFT_253441 [Agrocybe pediades]